MIESWLLSVAGVGLLVLAVYSFRRAADIRLSLLFAALGLGAVAQDPLAIVRKFLTTFSDEKFVVPICTAMGFAYVLRLTGCDKHLVHLLVQPLQRVRGVLIPGTVVVGFLVNMPIVSQTSTAVTIGPVVIPILQAARISPATTGAALLLGCSIGGELLNPGAPELRTTIQESERANRKLHHTALGVSGQDCVQRILPLNILGLVIATGVFWYMSRRAEARAGSPPLPAETAQTEEASSQETVPVFRVNYFRAMVPLVPLIVLYLVSPQLGLVDREILQRWLETDRPEEAPAGRFDSRLIGAAMLLGVAVAMLAVRSATWQSAKAFFEGAGYGFTHIISLIVAASCFGEGISQVGIAALLGDVIQEVPALLFPAAGLLPLGFAVLCGSGMASTQSLFGFFAEPAIKLGIDPTLAGAVVSLASAAGRTMSPVAAVVLMCAAMTNTDPWTLARRVAVPLLASVTAIVATAMILASSY
jgi:DcuC family C4-dicarboxylate transporter